jgi:hypothetical protein
MMPFAAVTYVSLEGFDPANADKLLKEGLIPRIKALPGFQAARFLRSLDGQTGVGAVIFDTEANAQNALNATTTERPAEFPPVVSSALYEVVVEV